MPIGSVIAVFNASRSQIPGSGCTTPNPDKAPRPTQPDQIATNAGNANSTTGQTRTAATVATGAAASAAGFSAEGCSPDPATTDTDETASPIEADTAGNSPATVVTDHGPAGSTLSMASSREALPAPTRNSRIN